MKAQSKVQLYMEMSYVNWSPMQKGFACSCPLSQLEVNGCFTSNVMHYSDLNWETGTITALLTASPELQVRRGNGCSSLEPVESFQRGSDSRGSNYLPHLPI